LPVQFKFRIALDCPPISAFDPELVTALGGGNAMGAIGVKETRALANLFARRSSAFSANKAGAGGGIGGIGGGGRGGPGSMNSVYKPPFKFNANVSIDITGSLYEIKKRLLGTNASTIIQLVDEIGSKNNIRIRMRGIGSGFLEGQQELQVVPSSLPFPSSLLNLFIIFFIFFFVISIFSSSSSSSPLLDELM
jgi:hypothetical protein